jgi:hypothetical protein
MNLAQRRSQVAEEELRKVQKQAENLGQIRDLRQAQQKVANAGGAGDLHLARKTGGGSGDALVGRAEPAGGSNSVNPRSRRSIASWPQHSGNEGSRVPCVGPISWGTD